MTATAESNGHAPTAAPQTGSGGDPETQRVGVHGGTPAGVHPPARMGARARARAKRGGKTAKTAISHDASHGAPWEEDPPSLATLRQVIHARAAHHEALPLGKPLYIAWGYAFIIPVSALWYSGIWVIQGPARTTVAAIVITILHLTHLMPRPPIGLIDSILRVLL